MAANGARRDWTRRASRIGRRAYRANAATETETMIEWLRFWRGHRNAHESVDAEFERMRREQAEIETRIKRLERIKKFHMRARGQ